MPDAPDAPDAPQSPRSPLTNASLEQIADRLRSAKRVVVLTHSKPDGDAIGSSIALVRAINMLPAWGTKPKAQAWYVGPLPAWLRAVVGDTPHESFEQPAMISAALAGDTEKNASSLRTDDIDAIVITDTCSFKQLDPLQQWLTPRRAMCNVIDHHVQGDEAVAANRFVEVSAAAVVQPVAKLCQLLLNAPSPDKLPAPVAEALYLGLATDTGWFRHSNVSRRVMTLAGELLDAGANHIKLYQCVEQQETPGRLRLISKALSTLDLRLSDRLAFMHLTMADQRDSGANPGETGGITDFTQAIPSVMVSAMLIETPPPSAAPQDTTTKNPAQPIIKISMRSKSEPIPVDVNAIASTMGGGGHVRAAGAKVAMTIDQTKSAIMKLVAEQLK